MIYQVVASISDSAFYQITLVFVGPLGEVSDT